MRNSGSDTLAKAKRVATNEICSLTVRIIQSIKEEGSRRAEKILYVLLERIDILARWIFGNLHIKRERASFIKTISL